MTTSLEQLESRLGVEWPHLRKARELALAKRQELRRALAHLDSEDTSIVVSGSLARDEFTEGSDINWTLLIDGQSDPDITRSPRKLAMWLTRLQQKPSGRKERSERWFLATIWYIRLATKTTQIGTRLDGSFCFLNHVVGREDAYRNVVRNVLNRYLLEDRGLWRGSGHRVPRLLQNDFARYWRTMAVDFAYKLRTRSAKGWPIRNTNLRMSRKLIYVSGLLACFRCHLDYSDEQRSTIFAEGTEHPN